MKCFFDIFFCYHYTIQESKNQNEETVSRHAHIYLQTYFLLYIQLETGRNRTIFIYQSSSHSLFNIKYKIGLQKMCYQISMNSSSSYIFFFYLILFSCPNFHTTYSQENFPLWHHNTKQLTQFKFEQGHNIFCIENFVIPFFFSYIFYGFILYVREFD